MAFPRTDNEAFLRLLDPSHPVQWQNRAQFFGITVPAGQIQDILGDINAAPQKVFVHVACASHYMVWENQHMSLLRASLEWLTQGTYAGQFNGTFAVDSAGQVSQEQ